MVNKFIYLYGFADIQYSELLEHACTYKSVYAIPYNNICAIVSNIHEALLDNNNRESVARLLVDHQKVLENILESGDIDAVPVKIGVAVKSKEEVVKIMTYGYKNIVSAIKYTCDKIEYDVVVLWDNFNTIITEIAADSDVVLLRQEMMNRNMLDESHRVKMGILIKTKIDEINRTVKEDVASSLKTYCVDVSQHEAMNDEMILNSAFLLNKGTEDIFFRNLDKLDEKYKGKLRIKIVGPLPCYSFSTVIVNEIKYSDIAISKEILDLVRINSEIDIKKAYYEKANSSHPDKNDNSEASQEKFRQLNDAYKNLIEYYPLLREKINNNHCEQDVDSVIYEVSVRG